MDDVGRRFSNRIVFAGDVDPCSFMPIVTYTGVIDSYGFNYVDELLAVSLTIMVVQRNNRLCNKCKSLIEIDNRFNLLLEFGHRNANVIIKKGSLHIALYSPDATVKATILLPPYSNYMDVKILNFNAISPECNCFFADADIRVAQPYDGNDVQYIFISPLQ